ncbi:MAG: hypothetical protein KKC75_04940 [Nanoarchaeota archaeon]|nr:hypothetical protein [Nanoarchaeota archaeon]
MELKSVSVLILFLVGVLACAGFASAELDVNVLSVDADDVEVNLAGTPTYIAGLEKGDQIDVEVQFISNFDGDIEVEASLSGDGYKDKVSDSTDEFSVHNGTTYKKTLTLELPQRMNQDKSYQLRVTISNKYDYKTVIGTLDIASSEHSIQIKDVVLSPENEVKAGRALLVTLRVKNRGTSAEEDVKVKASIPALGISASDYINELDCEGGDDDSTSSEELYMRIPDCAEPGQYTLKACVDYDDGDEEECATAKITVVESDTCVVTQDESPVTTGKTIITIGPETQDTPKGGSAMYPVTIVNQGKESKAYSVSVDSADWADFAVTPSNIMVVGAGESKSVYIVAKPKSGFTGLQVFSVTIKSGETVLKQVPLRTNIVGGTAAVASLGGVKRVLEVGLVILVVLLVILGLIIGFNKLKGSDDEEDKDEKTYY